MLPPKRPRYAAHWLQIGSQKVAYPLIEWDADDNPHLDLFTGEVSHTIFHSGTILLYQPNEPIVNTPIIQVSLQDLQQILDEHEQWLMKLL
ncbi:MAG: hypothetical protein Q4A64_07140 [Porphyromonadaceae bacterium]|nr:hypothetical protein [Porphyromonadaceae bacterium]